MGAAYWFNAQLLAHWGVMTGQKRSTEGYEERLRWALERGPRPMSVRGLAAVLQPAYPDLRGASYGGIRQYYGGTVASPRIELLRAIADVLQVRWEKLAYDEGSWTDSEEGVRTAAARSAEESAATDSASQTAEQAVAVMVDQWPALANAPQAVRQMLVQTWAAILTQDPQLVRSPDLRAVVTARAR